MSWINEPDNIEKYAGFLYLITNKINGKKYIGKKVFWFDKKVKPNKYIIKNGKKVLNKRTSKICSRVESDWKEYWGSGKKLLEDIEKLGKENFKREIIMLCETDWDLSYEEAKYQIINEVILRDDYYNGIINLRVPRKNNGQGRKKST